MAGLAPQQTLIPFDTLPECAVDCGPLYDANGGCVPPVFPTGTNEDYQNCFCQHTKVAGFRTGTTGVCDNICAAQGADATTSALNAIQSWFAGFCGVPVVSDGTTGDSSGDTAGGNATPTKKPKASNEGDWLSTHWQWVVMLVILVVGIAGIWIGACIWRRHYLKKKERGHALGKHAPQAAANTASWGPGAAPPHMHANGPGAFMSPANGHPAYNEKQKKKKSKWIVKERT